MQNAQPNTQHRQPALARICSTRLSKQRVGSREEHIPSSRPLFATLDHVSRTVTREDMMRMALDICHRLGEEEDIRVIVAKESTEGGNNHFHAAVLLPSPHSTRTITRQARQAAVDSRGLRQDGKEHHLNSLTARPPKNKDQRQFLWAWNSMVDYLTQPKKDKVPDPSPIFHGRGAATIRLAAEEMGQTSMTAGQLVALARDRAGYKQAQDKHSN